MLAAVKVKPRQSAAATTNGIRGLLKTFGMVLGGGKGRRFEAMVRERIAENPMLTTIIEPMLVVLLMTREQLAVFDRLVRRRARDDDDVRRLMTVPGVGAVIALAYTTTIEDPARFKRSSSVAAYLAVSLASSEALSVSEQIQ